MLKEFFFNQFYVLGNQNNWAKRKDQPLEVLVEHASNGYGLMPANLGREGVTKENITFAVKYMLSELEKK